MLYPAFIAVGILLIKTVNYIFCDYMVSEAEGHGQMAAILQTPASITFNSPDEWPKWKRRFKQYRVASGFDKENDEWQVSTLLYCLGEEADDMLTSMNITPENQKKFADVIQKFDKFFKVWKNVIFERSSQILQNSSLPLCKA